MTVQSKIVKIFAYQSGRADKERWELMKQIRETIESFKKEVRDEFIALVAEGGSILDSKHYSNLSKLLEND